MLSCIDKGPKPQGCSQERNPILFPRSNFPKGLKLLLQARLLSTIWVWALSVRGRCQMHLPN